VPDRGPSAKWGFNPAGLGGPHTPHTRTHAADRASTAAARASAAARSPLARVCLDDLARSTAPPLRPTRAQSTPSPLPSRATAPPPSSSLQRTPLSSAAPSSPPVASSASAPASMSTAPGGTRSQSQYDSAHSVLSPHFTGWRAAAAAAFPLHLLLCDFTIKF